MTATHKNFLKTTVSAVASAGLGAFTISTASSGHRTFGAGDDGLTFDGITVSEGTDWEVCDGCVYTHSGTSLSRGTRRDSSSGGAIAFTSAAVLEQNPSAGFADLMQLAMAAAMPGGRLTLESGVPVSTTDQTSKTSIYYTPFVNNVVPLWDGYKWRPIEFSETTLALGTLTSGKPYDVFGYISGGALALEALAWTDDTNRATAVTLQDGRYCKSGDKTRLLLGTFYTATTTTTEDSDQNRYLFNIYNRVPRRLFWDTASGSHTYASGTFREWNATTNRVRVINGIAGQNILVGAGGYTIAGTSGIARVGIGANSTSSIQGATLWDNASSTVAQRAAGAPYTGAVAVGLSYFAILQASGAGTSTFEAGRISGQWSC